MKVHVGMVVYLHSFLNSGQDGSVWSAAQPNCLFPRKESLILTQQESGWALKPVWKFCRKEKFPAPARNQTIIPQSLSTNKYTYYSNTCFTLSDFYMFLLVSILRDRTSIVIYYMLYIVSFNIYIM